MPSMTQASCRYPRSLRHRVSARWRSCTPGSAGAGCADRRGRVPTGIPWHRPRPPVRGHSCPGPRGPAAALRVLAAQSAVHPVRPDMHPVVRPGPAASTRPARPASPAWAPDGRRREPLPAPPAARTGPRTSRRCRCPSGTARAPGPPACGACGDTGEPATNGRAPLRRVPVSATSNFPASGSSTMPSLLRVSYLMVNPVCCQWLIRLRRFFQPPFTPRTTFNHNSPATRKVLQRMCRVFGDPDYQRLSDICITCASPGSTICGGASFARHDRHRSPPKCVPGPIRAASPDTCASTPCIRATATATSDDTAPAAT